MDQRVGAGHGELVKRFRKEIVKNYPSIRCQEIARVDWTNREQVANYYNGEKLVECTRIVGETARLTGELLERRI